MSEILGSGLAFPISVDHRGAIALASGHQDIDQAVHLILSTAPGERPMRPEFGCGIHDYVFDTIDPHTMGRLEYEIRIALDRWEPRIDVMDIRFDLERASEGVVAIELDYRLRATNDLRNLVYPFYLVPAEEGA